MHYSLDFSFILIIQDSLYLQDTTLLTWKCFQVGVLIEEPFPMLALDELCKQLHSSIREAIAMENSVHARLLTKMKGHSDGYSVNGWPNSSND